MLISRGYKRVALLVVSPDKARIRRRKCTECSLLLWSVEHAVLIERPGDNDPPKPGIRTVPCNRCQGNGAVKAPSGTTAILCPRCNGEGVINVS